MGTWFEEAIVVKQLRHKCPEETCEEFQQREFEGLAMDLLLGALDHPWGDGR